jgi:HD-like signal output (HDOD) protein
MEAVMNQSFVKDLAIPPRPEIVSLLFEEMSRDEPDLRRITGRIAADVGLSAAMLKVANSPAIGLTRKARSIAQAVDVLGMRNVASIATGLAIRHALGAGDKSSDMLRFWDTAEKSAVICARLARRLRGIPGDEAYTFGLFHDCGIPLLMRQHPRYKETLARANRSGDRSFCAIEEEDIGTHHGAVGYFLARSWQLSDVVCKAVLWHHDLEMFDDPQMPDAVRNFIGIGHIAEHVQHLSMRSTVDIEWAKFEVSLRRHFALTEEDFLNLVDDAQEALAGE